MTDEEFEPYRKLAINVMFFALLDRDSAFFRSEWSTFWSRIAGFDPDQVRPAAQGYIEQRKPWPLHLIPARYRSRTINLVTERA